MQRLGGQTDTVDCMAWLKKSSNGPVTVASLLERRVALSWQEGVALMLEIAEVFERSGKRSVPRSDNLALTPSGTVEFLRGRTQSGNAVSALARTLNSLLPSDRPTQLRLLVSTAGPDSSSYKSVGEFVEALKYFERPGRRNLLAVVHERALTAPLNTGTDERSSSDATPRKKRETRRRSRLMVPAVVVVLLATVVGGASLMERTQSGSVLERAEPLQAVASDAWSTALAATAEFRASASRDLSIVLEKMREATEDIVSETLGEVEVDDESEVETSSSEPRSAAPAPDLEPEAGAVDAGSAVSGEGEDAVEPEAVVTTEVAAVVEVGEREPAVAPLVSAALFDSRNVNVTPPVTIRLQLPTVADESTWNEDIGVVEAIVSPKGEVERVKLLSPPESVHQAMILSAIKTWRFRPAELDGLPVRYRQLIQVAIPR